MSRVLAIIAEAAKKKKSQSEPKNQTTSTSSPLRGANQDYSGVNTKNDNADYTISDDTHVMPPQPEWEKTSSSTRKSHVKHLVKVTSKGTHGKGSTPVAEAVAGVSSVRNTPVNMKTTSHTGSTSAPPAAKSMQSAADARRIQLDNAAQQQKEQWKKEAEQQKKKREAEAKKRQAEAQRAQMKSAPKHDLNQMKEGTMKGFSQFAVELDEAKRGRPRKDGSSASDTEDTGNQHLIMQMRKHISTRGQQKVTFKDGKSHDVGVQTAHKVIQHHDNLPKPADKEAFVAHASKSKEHMHAALAGKKEPVKPKVSLGGSGAK